VEGETADAAVNAARARDRRNLLATLLLSQGVPMLLGGDELGRTQGGNNNAYCQGDGLSWFDWGLDADRRALLAFARRLLQLREREPALHWGRFLGERDAAWLQPTGAHLSRADWERPDLRAFALVLRPPAGGKPTLALLFNAGEGAERFTLGGALPRGFRRVLDTADVGAAERPVDADGEEVAGRSLVVLRRTR